MKYAITALALVLIASCTSVSNGPSISAPASSPSGSYASHVNAVTGYEYGDSRESLMVVENLIRTISDDAAKTNALADDLAHGLTQTGTTRDAKEFICRQLWIIGREANVAHIAPLLKNPATADMARYALVNIPGSAADAALIAALGRASDGVKVGILNALGDRGANATLGNASAARKAARALRSSNNEDVAAAARDALRRI